MEGTMNGHVNGTTNGTISGDVDNHVLADTTRFDPLPDVKSIMVTGGNGFIGSWIIQALITVYPKNYHVVSFDKLDYGASTNNLSLLSSHPNFTFIEGDILSPTSVKSCLQTHSIDAIIHLAAQTNVDTSLKDPLASTTTNIEGTQMILECAKQCGVKKFIQMSSYEAYGATKPGENGHREDESLSPMNPYGAGKAAAEMLVTAAGHSSELEVMVVRANNVYGPRQFPDKIIPKFIMLLRKGMKLTLHGGGMQRKRYLYVSDAADAFNTILHRGKNGDIFNLGSYDEISNRDISARLIDIVDSRNSDSTSGGGSTLEDRVKMVPGRPYVDLGSRLDCEKLRALGWDQKVSLDDGLKRTVDWYGMHGDSWWGDISKNFQG